VLLAHQARRFAGAASLGIAGLGVAATALVFVTHPAVAESALAEVQRVVTCAVTGNNACVSGTNTSSGIGVRGSSKTGPGVTGSTTSSYGVKGSSGSNYGVFGTSAAGFAGVVLRRSVWERVLFRQPPISRASRRRRDRNGV